MRLNSYTMFFNFLLLQNAQLVRALQPSLMPTSNQLSIDWRHDDAPSPPSQSDRSPNDNQKNTYTLVGICVLLFAITGGVLIFSCTFNCSHDRHRDRPRSTVYGRSREVSILCTIPCAEDDYTLMGDSGSTNRGDTTSDNDFADRGRHNDGCEDSALPVAKEVAPVQQAVSINCIRW